MLVICYGGAVAQEGPSEVANPSDVSKFAQMLDQAQNAMDSKKWSEAAALYEQIVKINPVNGRFWNQLAQANYNAKNYRRSISAYEKQIELGSNIPANAAYDIACDYALLGEKEQALKWLEKAMAMGFSDLPHTQEDTDLESLRNDPRYRELVGLVDTSKMSREEGWRADLRLLSREIKRKGYNLFPRTGTEAAFDSAVRKVSDSVPQLTDTQMIIEISKIMRLVSDGHSGIMGGMRPEFLPNLPVQFYLFEEGLFVIAADPKYKDLLGAQVLKFGTRTPDEIVKGLEPIINRDNDIWIRQVAPYRMRNLNMLNALGLVAETDKVSLTVRRLDGQSAAVTIPVDNTQPNIWNVLPNPATWTNLPQTLSSPLPLYLKQPGVPYWMEYLPESKTVYVGFNGVRNDPKESLADFSERLHKFVEENDVAKVAVDMRWNNGGNTLLLNPLVQALVRSDKVNRRGHLFVIIGRRTFSAAQNAATFFERNTNAIFVGEPTGSSPNFVGEERPLTLPFSKIMVNVSDLYWESSYPYDKRTWIAPQIYIPPTFEAYRTNRDPAMEAIVNYK
jgi:tetratricopeptide (TPR) repeat protein